ncbi:MAG: hypothetical protein N3G18_05610, partial [Candidatus Saccharicenans sp.]|nr:hypothetical protein [Candidatus Saccharicenans sp.]
MLPGLAPIKLSLISYHPEARAIKMKGLKPRIFTPGLQAPDLLVQPGFFQPGFNPFDFNYSGYLCSIS